MIYKLIKIIKLAVTKRCVDVPKHSNRKVKRHIQLADVFFSPVAARNNNSNNSISNVLSLAKMKDMLLDVYNFV